MPLGPPAAATKFRPPVPVTIWVDRTRLTDELTLGANKPLVLLHGPAGYGKSTLAAQWVVKLAEQGARVSWFSLDQDDNNTIWFLSHLIESLLSAGAEIDPQLLQLLQERPTDAEKYVIPSMINSLSESGQPIVVVLDDWHRITEQRTRAVLSRLLEEGPECLRIVITSRTRNGLPLARLSVRDHVLEIDATSLRFDHQESRQWLVDINQLDLSGDDISVLLESTDGWAAALQLTWLSLKGQQDISQGVRNISGRHQAIGEYLAENVLDTLEPEVLDFLLSTSVTERICADLASTLSGERRGQAMLDDVQARDLFLQPLDSDGHWYRYHHLFEEYLRKRLERDHPERVQGLHQEAARWYAAHGHTSEAVDHALTAGNAGFAVQVVEDSAMLMVEHSKMATLLALLRKLPESRIATRPRLQIAVAWANCLLHYPGQSHMALERVEQSLRKDNEFTQLEQEELRIEALVVRRCLEMYADRIAPENDLRTEVLDSAIPLRPWIVSVAVNIVTYGELHAGRYPDALATQEHAQSVHDQTTGPFSGVYGRCFAGLAFFALLDVVRAEECWREALEQGRHSAGRNSHAARLAGGLLGQLLALRGEYEAAATLLEEARELGPHGGVVDFMMATYSSLARIYAWRGDLERAVAAIEAGETIAADLKLPRLQARLTTDRASIGLPWTEGEIHPQFDTHVAREVRASNEIVKLTTMILSGSGEAVEHARLVMDQATEYSDKFSELCARLALSEALQAAGHAHEASQEMKQILECCYRNDLPGLLLERNQNCRDILATIAVELKNADWVPSEACKMAEFVQRLLGPGHLEAIGTLTVPQHIASRMRQATPSISSRASNLKISSREREVLLLLERGLSNREIATSLFIGINTVKWHLKNLFTTFNVDSRQECVEAAYRTRVLSGE